MITEDYVSYEISRLLEKMGFHAPDLHGLDSSQGHLWVKVTHQMAIKWLREKHHIHIMISIGFDEDKMFYHPNFAQFEADSITYGNPIKDDFNTYEEAVEAALNYCLTELI